MLSNAVMFVFNTVAVCGVSQSEAGVRQRGDDAELFTAVSNLSQE